MLGVRRGLSMESSGSRRKAAAESKSGRTVAWMRLIWLIRWLQDEPGAELVEDALEQAAREDAFHCFLFLKVLITRRTGGMCQWL